MPKVLVYTEAPLLARGLVSLLKSVDELELDGVCEDAASLPERVAASGADAVLIDCDPGEHLETVARVLSRAPGAKIVVWMHRPPIETAYQAMNLGVRGILCKTLSAELTVKCLQHVSRGGLWCDEALSTGLEQGRSVNLTPRESELVLLVSQGMRNREIARTLSITEATVRVYLSALFRKVGVRDRYELALYGVRNLAARIGKEPGESRFSLLVTKNAAGLKARAAAH